ncbi:ferredoxin [archaeon]|jgi:ferredoxin|nr:ferredoxin [archaeon]MBT7128572.1 ferredoxin [archaeon]
MGHRITVDQNKCIGCGACAATCSDSFEMKDGKAHAVKSEVEELSCEKAAEAGCPVEAINVK